MKTGALNEPHVILSYKHVLFCRSANESVSKSTPYVTVAEQNAMNDVLYAHVALSIIYVLRL